MNVLRIGAGGFITGIDVASDDSVIIRADTFGGYKWNPAKTISGCDPGAWDIITHPSRMSVASLSGGIYEIVFAPSDPLTFYFLAVDGNLYKTVDGGTTITACPGWTTHVSDPNAYYRAAGVRHMAVDPKNPSVVYVGTMNNGIFVTTDGGTTFTALAAIPCNPSFTGSITSNVLTITATQGSGKLHVGDVISGGRTILSLGTGAGSLGTYNVSTGADVGSGTVTVTTPAVAPGGQGFVFDPNSAVVGGKTSVLYVSVWEGDQIWKTDNAGSTWAQLPAGPQNPMQMRVMPNGNLILTTQYQYDGIHWVADLGIWKWNGTSWAGAARGDGSISGSVLTITSVDYGTYGVGQYVAAEGGLVAYITSLGTGGGGIGTYNLSGSMQTFGSRKISASTFVTGNGNGVSQVLNYPGSSTNLVAISPAGFQHESTDGGATWGAANPINLNLVATGDIPWLAWTPNSYTAVAQAAFDSAGNLWVAMGLGVIVRLAGDTTTYHARARGIEQLVANGVISPRAATRHPMVYGWDRPTFYSANQDAFPSVHGPNRITAIVACWDADYCSDDGLTVVQISNFGDYTFTAISDDGGQTWRYPPSIDATVTNLTTNATSASGTKVLHFASVPALYQNAASRHMMVNVTDALGNTTVSAGRLAAAVDGTSITLDEPLVGDVASGATITVGLAGDPIRVPLQTNALTSSGNVLHFASVPNRIYIGMLVEGLSDGAVVDRIVVDISGGDVTLDGAAFSVASGDWFSFYAGLNGGAIACATPLNWVFKGSNETQSALYTTDGGKTWSQCAVPGIPINCKGNVTNGSAVITGLTIDAVALLSNSIGHGVLNAGHNVLTVDSTSQITMDGNWTGASKTGQYLTFESGFGFAYYEGNKHVAADRGDIGTFYLGNYLGAGLFFKSIDGGATWTLVKSNQPVNGDGPSEWNTVDGKAGNIVVAQGLFSGRGLFLSQDHGATWKDLMPASSEVYAYAIGAQGGTGTYPGICVYAKISGVTRFYQCDNADAVTPTWTPLQDGSGNDLRPPVSAYDSINWGDGDKNEYGRFYFAAGGSGWSYISRNA